MVNYKALKECVEKNGEVMVRLDTGEKIELHKHNVTFSDSNQEVIVDAATENYWLDANKIAYYWTHKEGIEAKD